MARQVFFEEGGRGIFQEAGGGIRPGIWFGVRPGMAEGRIFLEVVIGFH